MPKAKWDGCVLAVAAGIACLMVPLAADASEGAITTNPYRRVAERADVMVTVKFVLKLKMPGGAGDREIEGEATCLLIDADGLVLCSNTEVGGYVSLMSQLMGRGAGSFDVTATPRDIEVLLEGRSEGLESRILARDTERDLAWIQIDGDLEGSDVAVLDLSDSVELAPGDRFYRLRRMDKFFGAVPLVTEGVVAGVVSKPRKLLVPSEPASGGFGLPVFNAEGRLVGITVIQTPAAEDQIGGMLAGGMSFLGSAAKIQDMVGGLILPAAELAKATKLARESFAEDEEDE